jgi:NADH:ubiquinone oxidoreductase subunit 5 (subunit L)/multisubunit Na+/H+ antiporter MnhA subunit
VFEIVGLASFRLIAHYLARKSVHRGSSLSLGSNRIGDIILLAALLLGADAISSASAFGTSLVMLLVLSCSVKSVSVISYLWLSDAMEGPTSVSALLHSATLVVTGLVLASRSLALATGSTFLLVAFSLGVAMVSMSGSADPDSKKVAANSTVSMLSLLWLDFLSSPSSAVNLSVVHAGYKSSLFVLLAVFSVLEGSQDLRHIVCVSSTSSRIHSSIILLVSFCVTGSRYSYLKTSVKLSGLVSRSRSLGLYVGSMFCVVSLVVLWLGLLVHAVVSSRPASLPRFHDFVTTSWLSWCCSLQLVLVNLCSRVSSASTSILVRPS